MMFVVNFFCGPFPAIVSLFNKIRYDSRENSPYNLIPGSLSFTLLIYTSIIVLSEIFSLKIHYQGKYLSRLLFIGGLNLLLSTIFLILNKFTGFQRMGILTKRFKFVIAITGFLIVALFVLQSNVFVTLLFFNGLYFLPNLYIYYKAGKVYKEKKQRRFLALLIFLSGLFFVIVEIGFYTTTAPIFKYAQLPFDFYFPFFLYLFMTILFFDLILLINRIFHFIPVAYFAREKSKKTVFYIVPGVVSIIVLAGHLNSFMPVINEYDIQFKSNPEHGIEDQRKLRIVAASDFHLKFSTKKNFVKNIVEKINSQNPDLVLFIGDIIDLGLDDIINRGYSEDFRKIESKYGVFAVTGNHEYYGNLEKNKQFLRDCGFILLEDSVVNIADLVHVAGRKDRTFRKRTPMKKLIENLDPDLPIILLDHTPYNLREKAENGIDLQISGHTHHGQLFPFNFATEMMFEVSRGHLRKGNRHIIVTSGVGTAGPPVRTSSFSEIIVINACW